MNTAGKRQMADMALGGALGFIFFTLTSHSKSPINKKLPAKQIKRVHYSPHIKIEHKDRHYHLHHWAIFSVSYLPFLIFRKRVKSKVVHGFFIGSIVQGLFYKDRFKFVNPREGFESRKSLK